MAKSSSRNSNNTGAAKGKMRTAKAGKAATAAKAKPAARTRTAANPRTTTRAAAKRTTQRARQEEGASARLRPIRTRQSRDQILATVATDAGVERPIVERVARSLSQTLTRHLMRNGSGRVDIPYLGAALWRGHEGARKARKMASPILKGRIVNIPARRAMSVARIRVHSALREIVARA